MQIKSRIKDWFLASLFIAIAAFLYYLSYEQITDVGTSMEGVRSPRFFPRFILLLIIILSFIIIIQDKTAKRVERTEKVTLISSEMLILLAFAWGFVLSLEILGYFISGPILMAFLMIYLGQKNWKIILSTSLCFPVALYLFFDRFLDVLIPMGKVLGPILER